MTTDLINKHHIDTVTTAKGHLNQEASGLQRTKFQSNKQETNKEDMYPQQQEKTNAVIYSTIQSTDKAYLDLTGRFPYCSSRGNQYILIGYHYDSNTILGVPLKNRQATTITIGWNTLNDKLKQAGEKVNIWVLDNESSQDLKS